MRGVFVCEAVPRSSGGWEPQLSYAFDNQTLINHWVPNLAITRGVGNHDLRNKLIINHLKTTTCQTYCIVLKWTLPAEWAGRQSDTKKPDLHSFPAWISMKLSLSSHPSETQEDDQDSPKNIAECICNQGRPECSLEWVLFPEHKMIYQELDKDGED